MNLIKVSGATNNQLDWLVGTIEKIEGLIIVNKLVYAHDGQYRYCPTWYWEQGGPLLNQHKISRTIDHSGLWIAYTSYNLNDEQRHMQCDKSELVAGLRCLVALNLGEVVEVPEELCK
jgi:hypothetical protein